MTAGAQRRELPMAFQRNQYCRGDATSLTLTNVQAAKAGSYSVW